MPRPAKKQDQPTHIVARWTSSPIVYGWDSRERSTNADFHQPISLTSRREFVNDAGRVLDPKDVPELIRTAAKTMDLNIVYRERKKRDLSMAEAMLGAGAIDTEPDPRVRQSRRAAAIA